MVDRGVGPVGAVIGCGEWVVDLLDYLVMKYPHFSCLSSFC